MLRWISLETFEDATGASLWSFIFIIMKVSKMEDLAIILMGALADNTKDKYISLSKIAKKYKLSPLFLKHIALKLKNHGLIDSREGIHGGYRLVKSPESINMAEILEAISEGIVTPKCVQGECKIDKKTCLCVPFWSKFNRKMYAELSQIKLSDVIRK